MSDSVYNPFSNEEEVLFRDADGNLKVLKGGQVDLWQPSGQAAQAAAVPPAPVQSSELDTSVDAVVVGLKLDIPDEILRKRLRAIVRSRFKDVRDALETREALERSPKVGGFGLAPAAAEAAVGVIEEYYQQWSEQKRRVPDQSVAFPAVHVGATRQPLSVPSAPLPVKTGSIRPARLTPLPPTTPPPVAPLPSPSIVPRRPVVPASLRPRVSPQAVGTSARPSVVPAVPLSPREREIDKNVISSFSSPLSEITELSKVPSPLGGRYEINITPSPLSLEGEDVRLRRTGEGDGMVRGSASGGQVRAEIPPIPSVPSPVQPAPPPVAPPPLMPQSVAQTAPPSPPAFTPPPAVTAPPAPFRPKLVGPLEELQGMTLVDFRRLDSDPGKVTQRLREKIALLEQQSFGHKAAAIAAWRRSEIFQQYAEIAAAAMTEKKSIADIIKARQSAGVDVLTIAEFEAIADFNRTLRF